ncbi:MAG: bifunctional folylpolyglutamate synthase/dihydrofolate synthase [Bacteroidetes bacterium]|nr:bifunctional folylpolyglutamate synthase/dihydrofolate synthase [Bacteroidota bacterium]
MNYQETLDYLFAALPMFSKLGESAYKKDLTNTILLCDAIGNPQQKFKTIHVAGTNGKGSTSHMLAAILQTAGYKTGLYTSPHLKDFRERIKINGQVCEEDFVVDFTSRIQPLIKTIEPSFFEITVAMAFDYFAKHSVDIAIIEVGLGGRLDSTNIIVPELSIITNIGWDHMNLLGNSLELIAAEKAGIIKQNIPVVIGETIPESKPIFEAKALELNAPIHWASEQRWVSDFENIGHLLQVTIAENSTDQRHQYQLDLPGYYQTKNLLTVLSAVAVLQELGWKIDYPTIQKALAVSKKINGLHGRWEIVQEHPLLVLDVGHNEDGIKQIVAQLELVAKAQVHIIIGMVKDKEIDKVLNLLPKNAQYYFTKAQIPRALDQHILLEKAAAYNLHGTSYDDVNIAIQSAKDHAKKDDLILVCGSVFVIGEVH